MIDYYDALNNLLDNVNTTSKKTKIHLKDANNFLLAEDIYAKIDSPKFDNSAMDGYAISNLDRREWKIVDRIIAGDNDKINIPLLKDETVRIFTGARIPLDAKAVIKQEDTTKHNDILKTTLDNIKPNLNIRFQGEEFKKNQLLIKKNTLVNPAVTGVIASQGYEYINCFDKLNITIFSTGNELVSPGNELKNNEIYDSNRFMLLSWLKKYNINIIDGGIIKDNKDETTTSFKLAAKNSDIVICSGGVSVGEEDYLKDVLSSIGKITNWKVKIKPGKPFAWGNINNTKFFLLPGNPVSTFVIFKLLVLPTIKKMIGFNGDEIKPKFIYAKANFDFNKKNSRRTFLPGIIYLENQQLYVKPYKDNNINSAMLSSCVYNNSLIEIEPNTIINNKELVKVYPFNYE